MAATDVFQSKLDALRDTLAPELGVAQQPGQPVVATLTDLPSGLSLVDAQTTNVPAQVDMTWIAKDVLFNNFRLETVLRTFPPDLTALNNLISREQPFVTPGSLVTLAGTPGVVGQLIGSVPIPTTVSTELPVSVAVQWKVLDEKDQPLPDDAGKPPEERQGLLNTLAAGPDRAAFLLAPEIVEDSGVSGPARVRKIRATVTLSVKVPAVPPATTPTTLTSALDVTVTVAVPALRIPTLIALFVHGLFDLTTRGGTVGSVLFLVPPESPYRDLASLTAVLGALAQALDLLAGGFSALPKLGSLGPFSILLGRLVNSLLALADPRTTARFVILGSAEEPKLSRFDLSPGQSANDTFGSLLLLGSEGKGGQFFNAFDWKTDEGAFEVKVLPDHLATLIPSLHVHGPEEPPNALPAGGTTLIKPAREGESFGNRISSYRLLP
jgi:hypothetical protein